LAAVDLVVLQVQVDKHPMVVDLHLDHRYLHQEAEEVVIQMLLVLLADLEEDHLLDSRLELEFLEKEILEVLETLEMDLQELLVVEVVLVPQVVELQIVLKVELEEMDFPLLLLVHQYFMQVVELVQHISIQLLILEDLVVEDQVEPLDHLELLEQQILEAAEEVVVEMVELALLVDLVLL
jgi:hypothetical protein